MKTKLITVLIFLALLNFSTSETEASPERPCYSYGYGPRECLPSNGWRPSFGLPISQTPIIPSGQACNEWQGDYSWQPRARTNYHRLGSPMTYRGVPWIDYRGATGAQLRLGHRLGPAQRGFNGGRSGSPGTVQYGIQPGQYHGRADTNYMVGNRGAGFMALPYNALSAVFNFGLTIRTFTEELFEFVTKFLSARCQSMSPNKAHCCTRFWGQRICLITSLNRNTSIFKFMLSFNSRIILSKEINVPSSQPKTQALDLQPRNDPEICATTPLIHFVKLCLKMYELQVTEDSYHVCFALSGRVYYDATKSIDLYCFRLRGDGKYRFEESIYKKPPVEGLPGVRLPAFESQEGWKDSVKTEFRDVSTKVGVDQSDEVQWYLPE